MLITVDWWVPDPDPMEVPSYRDCDICERSAADDAIAGKQMEDFRQFFYDTVEGLSVCEHCLEEYVRHSADACLPN